MCSVCVYFLCRAAWIMVKQYHLKAHSNKTFCFREHEEKNWICLFIACNRQLNCNSAGTGWQFTVFGLFPNICFYGLEVSWPPNELNKMHHHQTLFSYVVRLLFPLPLPNSISISISGILDWCCMHSHPHAHERMNWFRFLQIEEIDFQLILGGYIKLNYFVI